MKLKVLIIGLATFWIVMFVAFAASKLRADDVYNFYFQKAPGPVTVNQGGNSPAANNTNLLQPSPSSGNSAIANPQPTPAQALSAEGAQIATKPEPVKEVADNDFRHWQLSFGRSTFSTAPAELQIASGNMDNYTTYNQSIVGGQWTLGLEYKFSRYFAADLDVMQLQDRPIKFDRTTNFDLALGLAFTPFQISIFGTSVLDIGFIGGYISLPYETYSEFGYGVDSNGNYYRVADPDVQHKGTYYAGLKAEVMFTKGFSFVGNWRILPEANSTMLTAALAVNL